MMTVSALLICLAVEIMAAPLDPDRSKDSLPPGAERDYVYSACLSKDKKTLVVGGDWGGWTVWDLETGQKKLSGKMATGTAQSIALSPDGKLLAAGDDRELKVFDAASGKLIKMLEGHHAAVVCLSFTPDGAYLVSAAHDNMLRVWDVKGWGPQATFRFTSKELFRNGWEGHPDRPHERAKVTVTFPQVIYALENFAVTPDSSVVAVTTGSRDVLLLELLTGKVIKSFKIEAENGANAVAFSPDGKALAIGSGSWDDAGTIEVWDVATVKRQATFEKHAKTVLSLAFSADGKKFLSGGFDGAKLWDLVTGKVEQHVMATEQDLDVRFVGFLQDGKTYVTAGGYGAARFWDATTGKEISPIKK